MTGGAAPKRKGDRWERTVRDYWIERGYRAERCYGAGRPDDVGDLDVAAWIRLIVECKAVEASARAGWLDKLRGKLQALGLVGEAIPIIIERRTGKPVASAYVTVELWAFVDLIDEIQARAVNLATGGSND